MNYQLAVVIINYKTPEMLIDCLESLLPEMQGINAKIVVVDNFSQDNSLLLIQQWIDEKAVGDLVMLIASTENSGFSGGNNTGVSAVNAAYYLLLNSDTLVRQGAIALMLEAAGDNSEVGLVSPRLEWPDATPQTSCFRFHTPISQLIGSANTGLITSLLKQYNVPYAVSNQRGFYDWTSFACVLVRAEVFKDVGLMDDGYFMYYEDVAFAYHAKQAGWKVLNIPDAHVVHLRGGSSPVKSQAKLRKRLPRYYYESRTRFFYQVYGRLGLLMANILWTLGWGISTLRRLLASSFKASVSEFQWKDIWTNFFSPLKPYIHPDEYDKS